jgi:hypothetical protein
VQRSLGQMTDGMCQAAAVLRQLLKAQSENVRLGAARSLLELGITLRQSVEIEERLKTLEDQAEHLKRKTNE